ncbi:MAG: hypothetical protein ACREQQ_00600 [Candidatus Binatia bacterium]
MPLSVRLDVETERMVIRVAKSRRQTKSQVIREAVRAFAGERAAPESGATFYDAIVDHVGCFESGVRNLSKRTGKRFTKMLLTERARGRRSR